MKFYSHSNIAQKNGMAGCVIVTFVVDENGKVIGKYIHKGIEQYLGNEALRIVRSMLRWISDTLMKRQLRYQCAYRF